MKICRLDSFILFESATPILLPSMEGTKPNPYPKTYVAKWEWDAPPFVGDGTEKTRPRLLISWWMHMSPWLDPRIHVNLDRKMLRLPSIWTLESTKHAPWRSIQIKVKPEAFCMGSGHTEEEERCRVFDAMNVGFGKAVGWDQIIPTFAHRSESNHWFNGRP